MSSFLAPWRLLDNGRDRSEFYRMWRAGIGAGLTTSRTLETMGPRDAPQVENIRTWLLQGSLSGEGLGELVRLDGGKRFDSFERSLLTLGDEAGTLESSLRLLADFYARKHRLMLRVRKKMAYPLFTCICATFIAPFPLLYLGHTWTYLVVVITGLAAWVLAGGSIVLAMSSYYGRQPAMVRAQLARAIATAVEAGLPLGRSIRLAADASASSAVRQFIAAIDERRLAGQPVAATLALCPHMTPDFLAVLQVAELTGDYTGSLGKLADLYDDGFR